MSVCAGDVVLSVGDSASTLFGLTEASASGQCGPAAAGTAASAAAVLLRGCWGFLPGKP